MACSHVGGLSGAFIPVSEDAGMIDAVFKWIIKRKTCNDGNMFRLD